MQDRPGRAAPTPDDLAALGLSPTTVLENLGGLYPHGAHALYRGADGSLPFILKWFPDGSACHEAGCYALLRGVGVPTIALVSATSHGILLEDLRASAEWRLAGRADVCDPAAGAAVALWYRTLHGAGSELERRGALPAWLHREVDDLSPAVVWETGRTLQLDALGVWAEAQQAVDRLCAAARGFPETLNYNDFHWSNLALSREARPRAVVFDYDLLGIGYRYSDCRNVAGSLGAAARDAFWAAYGPADPREQLLDYPLSVLYGLAQAARRPALPAWADPLLDEVRSGRLREGLLSALAAI